MKKIRRYFINNDEVSEERWMEEFNDEDSLETLEIKQESIEIEDLLKKIEELTNEVTRLKQEKNYCRPWSSGNPYDAIPTTTTILYDKWI